MEWERGGIVMGGSVRGVSDGGGSECQAGEGEGV